MNNALLTLENEFKSVELWPSTSVTRVLIISIKLCNMINKAYSVMIVWFESLRAHIRKHMLMVKMVCVLKGVLKGAD